MSKEKTALSLLAMMIERVKELEQENKRLREALEKNWNFCDYVDALIKNSNNI
ncbi:MAG: hypothetical protein OEN49_09770 [Gammaproteobacteria bacterium]|nr:hypothetical protein [Gammaproteobacteria bacterium]